MPINNNSFYNYQCISTVCFSFEYIHKFKLFTNLHFLLDIIIRNVQEYGQLYIPILNNALFQRTNYWIIFNP